MLPLDGKQSGKPDLWERNPMIAMYEKFQNKEHAIEAAKALSHTRAVTVVHDSYDRMFKLVPYGGVALMRTESPVESFWRGKHPYA